MINASKLLYDDLSRVLINEIDFKRNEYDTYVLNTQIKGSQCTIIWHVDDTKISHKDPEVISGIIKELEHKYADIMPL